ncbi:MAG: hypothetical protein ACKV22_04900, partial [Bryobacteraceae bacterium]
NLDSLRVVRYDPATGSAAQRFPLPDRRRRYSRRLSGAYPPSHDAALFGALPIALGYGDSEATRD